MKKYLFLLLFSVLLYGMAAEPYAIPLLGEKPIMHREEKIAPGIVFSSQQYAKLFSKPLSLSILSADLNQPDVRAAFVLCGEKRMTPQAFGEKHHALAAVNGGFFVMGSKPPASVWGRKSGGKILQKFERIRNGGVLAISADGKQLAISSVRGKKRYVPETDPFPSACVSLPLLIHNGKKYLEDPDAVYKSMLCAPRTIIALTNGNKLILLVADGRTKSSGGLKFSEAQTILLKLGAAEALAMDGGGSSAMWIRNRGIVSHPSDNKKFDHKGARAVHDAILIFGGNGSGTK